MGAYPALRQFTVEEYLRLERAAKTRSEFVNGQIYAMAGGTVDHARIIKNLDQLLQAQLEGGTCESWPADLRIGISIRGPFFYPDLSVICGDPQLLDTGRDCALNPVVVFEVLSKSTRKYDRETKAAQYKEIPTLRHVVLVAQELVSIEHHFRSSEGKWKIEKLTDQAANLELTAIRATLPVAGVYRKLRFAV